MKPTLLLSVPALIIAFSTACGPSNGGFKLPAGESVQALLFSEEVTLPEEILEAVQDSSGKVVLVDIRTPAEFANGHLLNAVNIPAQDVLEPASRKLWRNTETTFYFYGNTQLDANGPWMILRQMGFTNIRVLQGGLSYFADFSDSSFLKLEDETARYDYASIFSKAVEDAAKANAPAPKPVAAEKTKTIVPQKRPKLEQPAVKQPVVQEEEGC